MLQQSVKKMVEIPDHKSGKYMMEQQIVSLLSAVLGSWLVLSPSDAFCLVPRAAQAGWSQIRLLLPLQWVNFTFTSLEIYKKKLASNAQQKEKLF